MKPYIIYLVFQKQPSPAEEESKAGSFKYWVDCSTRIRVLIGQAVENQSHLSV